MPTETPRSLRVVQPHVRLDDPHVVSDDPSSLALRGAIFEALVRRVDAARFAPALASGWHTSPDARRWTFVLRPGVLAHDGGPLAPSDVLASLERARDPHLGGVLGTEGVYAGYLGGARLEIGEERGAATLRIDLERPMADLLDLLAELPMLPERAHGLHARRPVGTGPYALAHVGEGEVELVRWASQWSGGGRFDSVVFRAEASAEARAAAVQSGQADLADGVTPELARAHQGSEGLRVVARPGSTCVAFFFDLAPEGVSLGASPDAARGGPNGASLDAPRGAPLLDARVRRALHRATDIGPIIQQVMHGYARGLSGPFTELHLAFDPQVPGHAFDPERARALLAEAGWGDGLALTADVPTRLPDEAQAVAELLRQQWALVGVQLRVLAVTDRPEYARMVREKRIHDLCCFDSAPISSYRVLVEKFHGGVRGPWWQGYRNVDVDQLIERGAATVDVGARRDLYRQVFRHLVHDAPWLSLYAPQRLWLAGQDMSDWEPSFAGFTAL
jgi:peptide/nickel transport system substrate-binding protein